MSCWQPVGRDQPRKIKHRPAVTPGLTPGPGLRGSGDGSLIPGQYFHLCASIPFLNVTFSLPKELGVQQAQRKSSGAGDCDGVSPERDLGERTGISIPHSTGPWQAQPTKTQQPRKVPPSPTTVLPRPRGDRCTSERQFRGGHDYPTDTVPRAQKFQEETQPWSCHSQRGSASRGTPSTAPG